MIYVAVVSLNLLVQMLSAVLAYPKAVYALLRIVQEVLEFGTVLTRVAQRNILRPIGGDRYGCFGQSLQGIQAVCEQPLIAFSPRGFFAEVLMNLLRGWNQDRMQSILLWGGKRVGEKLL
jgi:hypothetical protein